MAGVTGIEPVTGEFRVHCLTAWLHPNDINFPLSELLIRQELLLAK